MKIKKEYIIIGFLAILLILSIARYEFQSSDKAPRVKKTYPVNHTQNVPVDIKTIKFVFNKKMAPPAFVGYMGTRMLESPEPSWEDEDRTVLTVPVHGSLLYSATYAVVLNPERQYDQDVSHNPRVAMQDTIGNKLSEYALVFTTEPSPEQAEIIKRLHRGELTDTDKDGLEDELENSIGADVKKVDTDGDGLTDYEEYCKYKTDPTKKDSDGDGNIDNDWEERREYTYTVKAICELNEPVDLNSINDLFQDARIIRKKTSGHHTTYEIILYPDSIPRILPTKYPYRFLPDELKRYTQSSAVTNYSQRMQREIKKMVATCSTDIEAIEKIQREIMSMKLIYRGGLFLNFYFDKGKLVMAKNPINPEVKEMDDSAKRLLDSTYYGDSMFFKRQHGMCSSRATLRATMLKAAGIPTRLINAVPLIYYHEGEPSPAQNLKNEKVKGGYYCVKKPKSPKETYIISHTYCDVYLNNHWIRLDYRFNEGILFANKYMYLKIISFADWDEVNFTQTWSREQWYVNRPYKTIELSDMFPKYGDK